MKFESVAFRWVRISWNSWVNNLGLEIVKFNDGLGLCVCCKLCFDRPVELGSDADLFCDGMLFMRFLLDLIF